MNTTVQALWIGQELSLLEQLSIRSFLAHGHGYQIFTYEPPANIPAGVTVCDAAEILPRSAVFEYTNHKSFAGFANFFRYKLLLERGGWWVDTDIVCVRPFDSLSEYVFASERDGEKIAVNNGVIKAPAASEVMAYCWNECSNKDPAKLAWGETGPCLLTPAVDRLGLARHVAPPQVFCPFSFREWETVLQPRRPDIGGECAGIHLWNEMWRRAGYDKNASYHPESLFERLKATYM